MNSKTTTSFPGSNIVVQMVPAGENEHVAHDWATNRFPNNFSFGSNLSKYSENLKLDSLQDKQILWQNKP